MISPLAASYKRYFVGLSLVLVSALFAACDSGPPVDTPTDITRQNAPTPSWTDLQFHVTRGNTGVPVEGATISLYLDNSSTAQAPTPCANADSVSGQNCWLTTDANGNANVFVPTGNGVGYLPRLVPPSWTSLVNDVVPPLASPDFGTVANDLGALTCGRRNPEPFTPGKFDQCFRNLYLTPRGNTQSVDLELPITTRTVDVKNLNGSSVSGGVAAYLVEALQAPLPWQSDLSAKGLKAGFLRYYAPASNQTHLPGGPGYIEVYGTSSDGFEIAGTQTVTTGDVTVETSPVICANGDPQQVSQYRLTKNFKSPFTFTDAIWAFAAKRGASEPLEKDLTTTVLVLKFQTTAAFTLDISQRNRTANGTNTASATIQCDASGHCDTAGASINVPGNANPMQPFLYQPKNGKIFWVVKNLDPTTDSEWSAKASNGTGVLEQLPKASKSNASSAFLPWSKVLSPCDVNFSFDGGWGCNL